MQNKIAALALGGVLTLGMGVALAQDTQAPPPQANGAPARGERGMNPDRQLARLTKELSLTSAQQDQIRPLLAERAQKMQALMQNQALAPEDRRTQMRTVNEGTQNGIVAVLTDEQKQKYAAMREEMREHRGHGRGPAPDGGAQPQS
jgi:Spy/CpxP family protein refolding chaperone